MNLISWNKWTEEQVNKTLGAQDGWENGQGGIGGTRSEN